MAKEILRPAWVEIDLECIRHNIFQIQQRLGHTQIIGVVKADGYGHGAIEVSKVLLDCGVSALAIGTIDEAIELREAGIDCSLITIGLTPKRLQHLLVEYNITPVVASYLDTKVLSSIAVEKAKRMEVLIALESGMGRIGYMHNDESIDEIIAISKLPNIDIKGAFSHFATSDDKDKSFAFEQIKNFNFFCQDLERQGISLSFKTHGNSGAIVDIPEGWYDAVRPGIIMYGYYPSSQVDRELLDLRPAMSLKANISFIKKVPKGTSISYGRNFVTERESIIATLPLGYADGYWRGLSGKGRVLVQGEYAPIIGAICMNQCMIDVTDIPKAKKNDEVVLLGSQGKKTITVEEIANKLGTISYEVICGVRVPRKYINK